MTKAVFREIVVDWDGASYRIVPTLRLVRSIESEISILPLLTRTGSGDVPISHVAYVVWRLLEAAEGSDDIPDEDTIFSRLIGDPELMRDAIAVVSVALGADPGAQPKDTGAPAKNPEAPAEATGASE